MPAGDCPPSGRHDARASLSTARTPQCQGHVTERGQLQDVTRPMGPSSKRLRDTGRTAGWRDKTHPTSPLPRPIVEKTRPASPKTPNVGCCERAGRTILRTGRSNVAALKPTTPLQPLTWASMKPPSPLLAPKQQPLKPMAPMLAPKQQALKPLAPLQPKNTPKTPISHPQRRSRFQLAHLTGPQRRRRFQSRLALRKQRHHRFQTTTHLASGLPLHHQQEPMRPLPRKLACNSIG